MSEPRILAVQMADIGDLVLALPALYHLRMHFPDAVIDLLTTPNAAPVVRDATMRAAITRHSDHGDAPLVNRVLTMDRRALTRRAHLLADVRAWAGLLAALRRQLYTQVVFFHHLSTRAGVLKYAAIAYAAAPGGRRFGLDNGSGFFLTDRLRDGGFGAQHEADYWRGLVGLMGAGESDGSALHLIGDADRAWAAEFPKPTGAKRVIVHAGSGGYSRARRWDAEKFARVADALAEAGAQIVLVGSRGDDAETVNAALSATTRARLLDLSQQTTLGQLWALLASADLFIGADSGVMHMAAAAGAPVLALFGPSNADAWHPYSDPARNHARPRAVVLRAGVECSPCSYIGFGVAARNGCAARTCMRLLTPERVIAAARAMLDDPAEAAARLNVPPRSHGAVSDGQAVETAATIRILGFPVSAITYEGWLAQIERWVQGDANIAGDANSAGIAHHVCTLNPEFIMIARRDPIFAAILRRCALTVPDGVGLLWAARRLGTPLPQRVTGSDGVPMIAARAAREGWGLFFLGAAEGVAERAAEVLRVRLPGVRIVGVYSGSPAPAEEDALVARVNASGADILFVAYGAPEQDKWIARNLPRLRITMAMGVGGSFDFIAGVVPRAPLAMQRLGLEWLYRLYLQPTRIRRMLRLPRFIVAVLLRGRDGT